MFRHAIHSLYYTSIFLKGHIRLVILISKLLALFKEKHLQVGKTNVIFRSTAVLTIATRLTLIRKTNLEHSNFFHFYKKTSVTLKYTSDFA